MRLSEMLARSAQPKPGRGSLRTVEKKSACGSTPIVMVTKRKVKTKRSNRVEKVRAWEAEYGVRTGKGAV